MARPRHNEQTPDLYQLLGVPREATPADIARAWRRKARALHPDTRPGDTGAPARFRDLARAYQVLSDPARRAAYDRALDQNPASRPRAGQPARSAAVPVTVVSPSAPAGRHPMTPPARRAPLWAGPVAVQPPGRVRDAGPGEQARLTLLAELAARYLDESARDRRW